MNPARTAHVDNVSIVRDRINICLVGGTIQFAKPVNSVVFGAVFHGKGRVQVEPRNDTEAQQLRLFSKRDKVDLDFNDATFSFTDEFFDEIAPQVKWRSIGPVSDDLYTSRQTDRENLGAAYLPRLSKAFFPAIAGARHIFSQI